MVLVFAALLGCTSKPSEQLPYLGVPEIVAKEVDGSLVPDTIYHSVGDFRFVNQDSSWVDNSTFADHIYVADFFFTSCPSICPIMKTQMLRVYDEFAEEPIVKFLSHTIDPKHDSVSVLREYADRLGVAPDRWHFVTGEKKDIYEVAQVSYMSVAAEDGAAPGGFIHSGRFLLVDKERHIRGAYDGTDAEDVDQLILDLRTLISEYEE